MSGMSLVWKTLTRYVQPSVVTFLTYSSRFNLIRSGRLASFNEQRHTPLDHDEISKKGYDGLATGHIQGCVCPFKCLTEFPDIHPSLDATTLDPALC